MMKFGTILLALFLTINLNGQEFKFKKKIGKYVFKKSNGKFDKSLIVDEYVKVIDGSKKIRIGSNWGMINYDGEITIKPIYQEVQKFLNDEAIVKIGGKYGILKKSGEFKLEPIYDRIDFSNVEESLVQLNGKWGLLKNGVIKPVKESIVFMNPDVKPQLISCIGEDDECTSRTMVNEFFGNVRYPQEAVINKIEGIVVAEIIINTLGSIDTINILKNLGGGLEEATIETLEMLFLDWKPAEQDGGNVKSRIVFPVRFRLE